jgi:hypothetical protein
MANSLWLGCAPDQDSHVRLKHNSVRRERRRLLLLTCFGLGLLAHSPARASDDDIQSQRNEYAKACRDAIGPVRAFSCADGAVVPITVNGEPVDPTANQTCDRPALLDNGDQSDGQCVPNSRIVSLSTATAQVTAMCRQKKMRDASSMQFDEIDVVAHNPTTGATCWFQAVPQSGRPVEGASVPVTNGRECERHLERSKGDSDGGARDAAIATTRGRRCTRHSLARCGASFASIHSDPIFMSIPRIGSASTLGRRMRCIRETTLVSVVTGSESIRPARN